MVLGKLAEAQVSRSQQHPLLGIALPYEGQLTEDDGIPAVNSRDVGS